MRNVNMNMHMMNKIDPTVYAEHYSKCIEYIHFENSAEIATEALVMQILTESSMKSLIHENGPDFAFLKPH